MFTIQIAKRGKWSIYWLFNWDFSSVWNLVRKCPCSKIKIRASLRYYYNSFMLLDFGSCSNIYVTFFSKYKTNRYYKVAQNLSRKESSKYLWSIYCALNCKGQSTSKREQWPVADFLAKVWPSLPDIAQCILVVESDNFNISGRCKW